MEFEMARDGDLGAPVQDVAQEAVDATATRYTRTPDIDVEQTLREQLQGRGIRAVSEATIGEIATSIRAGHSVRLGRHDGSIEG
ncbi:hypothetical protein SFC79_08090 [Nocardioides sp. S-58]|uniref:Uncharacterized protein n=1 Tax=Nocardioides renjunii TaxID=3095075 RepID=A0ABU5KA57_9ACTN|nr:hypothetical protein [Nocardioides sp. S-58]MDZ5661718.1 hypothetical protein [Nocardioides sp. S-58]